MPTPACHYCHLADGVAIYDHERARVALCLDCSPAISPVVESSDLEAVARSGLCWCHLSRTGLQIKWCPHFNQQDSNHA
jgi:hypothetical protein